MANVRLTQDLSMLTEGLKLSVMYAYDVSNRRESSYTKREIHITSPTAQVNRMMQPEIPS